MMMLEVQQCRWAERLLFVQTVSLWDIVLCSATYWFGLLGLVSGAALGLAENPVVHPLMQSTATAAAATGMEDGVEVEVRADILLVEGRQNEDSAAKLNQNQPDSAAVGKAAVRTPDKTTAVTPPGKYVCMPCHGVAVCRLLILYSVFSAARHSAECRDPSADHWIFVKSLFKIKYLIK
jgi:hypothetical protein